MCRFYRLIQRIDLKKYIYRKSNFQYCLCRKKKYYIERINDWDIRKKRKENRVKDENGGGTLYNTLTYKSLKFKIIKKNVL